MPVGRDHEVAGRVGELVEEDEGELAAVDHELRLVLGQRGRAAEDALVPSSACWTYSSRPTAPTAASSPGRLPAAGEAPCSIAAHDELRLKQRLRRRLRRLGGECAGRARRCARTPRCPRRSRDADATRRGTDGAGGRRAEPSAVLTIRLEPLGESASSPGSRRCSAIPRVRFTRVPGRSAGLRRLAWLGVYEEARARRHARGVRDRREDGEFLGIAVAPRSTGDRTAELGYVVSPAARGRGVATEALRRLTRVGVRRLGMLRMELLISVENPASQKVAERCGLRPRGRVAHRLLQAGPARGHRDLVAPRATSSEPRFQRKKASMPTTVTAMSPTRRRTRPSRRSRGSGRSSRRSR